jgi:ribosomal protein S18 acetylase RimI-like enzyme
MKESTKEIKVPVEIREIELEDLAPVYALGEKLFTADKWAALHRTWDEYEVLNLYMTDGDTCLVAELDGKVVGFALGATISKRRSSWKYGYLLWLGVSTQVAGMGVGKKLVKRLTELFIQDGARMMLVDTDADNEEAIGFFKKAGFANEQRHVYMSMNLTKHPSYERLRPPKAEKKEPKNHEGPKT